MRTTMKMTLLIGLTIAFFTLSLAACEKEGPAEKAGKQIDQTVEKAGDKIDQTMEKAGDKVEKATD